MYLSDVFKFTQGLGQKGHQIGRKVGDAIELLTLGMINLNGDLVNHLVIEDGVEGATSAKHKVEFSFYNLNHHQRPSKLSEDLFGIIECKKVGVEQTIKQNFKQWKELAVNKKAFHLTDGYDFTISPSGTNFKWSLAVTGEIDGNNNVAISIDKFENNVNTESEIRHFHCTINQQILVVVDDENNLFILGPGELLSQIEGHISKCIVIEIQAVADNSVTEINVNESLAGPQTPEKAKQASFVSLDVRKKVLGHFDKTDDSSFISVLIIGEGSHWEEKSRSMVRLCNDYNLIVPDDVLVYLFNAFEQAFGLNYQDSITKTSYKTSAPVRQVISDIIAHFEQRVFCDMDTNLFMTFGYINDNGTNQLQVVSLN